MYHIIDGNKISKHYCATQGDEKKPKKLSAGGRVSGGQMSRSEAWHPLWNEGEICDRAVVVVRLITKDVPYYSRMEWPHHSHLIRSPQPSSEIIGQNSCYIINCSVKANG